MTKEELKTYIENNFAGKLTILESGKYDLFFEVSADNLVTVCQLLKDDAELHFDYLCNISGFDTGEQFGAVYDIASSTKKLRLDLKVNLSHENPELDSIQTVWKAANWYEREMWELYGINIKNHDNLTRFLLPDDWDQGHPMRKDWDAPDFIRFPEL